MAEENNAPRYARFAWREVAWPLLYLSTLLGLAVIPLGALSLGSELALPIHEAGPLSPTLWLFVFAYYLSVIAIVLHFTAWNFVPVVFLTLSWSLFTLVLGQS